MARKLRVNTLSLSAKGIELLPDSQPLQTKLTTIQERRHDIPWFSLPRTFQDAIVITRRLGVQYIWIDSLCIVQDDGDDWRKEASKICDVYQNAWLNLAATKSFTCHDGLFSRVPQKQISVIGHDCNFDVGARQLIHHSKLLPGEDRLIFHFLSGHGCIRRNFWREGWFTLGPRSCSGNIKGNYCVNVLSSQSQFLPMVRHISVQRYSTVTSSMRTL